MAGFTPPVSETAPGPCAHGFAITPGATALPSLTRYIVATAAGTITCQLAGDTASITLQLAAGIPMPIVAEYVTAATATGLIGLY